jgi:hypothetical protein
MLVVEVKDKKTEKDFYKLPDFIYQNDKNYIPHLIQDVKKVFDPKHNKLFKHKGKLVRYVLYNQEKAIGRVAAFINPKTAKAKPHAGGMGFFECINNQEAANMLFEACKIWLKNEGMQAMDGPINFGEKDRFWGLLVENFTDPNSYAMNYNPPYYRELFEAYGFKMYYKQLMYWRDMNPAQDIFVKKAGIIRSDKKFSVTHAAGWSMEQLAQNFLEVYNAAWAVHEGFAAMRIEQARNVVKALKPILDPDIVLFAFYDGKPIGFYINIPELNEFFQHVNGNLNWWGKLKFLYYYKFKQRKTMVGIVFGVSKAHQGRGVEGAMIKYGEEHILPLKRYSQTIITWIGDFNPRMLRVIENLNTKLYRTLHTYRYMIDDSIPFERYPIINMHNEKAEKQQDK